MQHVRGSALLSTGRRPPAAACRLPPAPLKFSSCAGCAQLHQSSHGCSAICSTSLSATPTPVQTVLQPQWRRCAGPRRWPPWQSSASCRQGDRMALLLCLGLMELIALLPPWQHGRGACFMAWPRGLVCLHRRCHAMPTLQFTLTVPPLCLLCNSGQPLLAEAVDARPSQPGPDWGASRGADCHCDRAH